MCKNIFISLSKTKDWALRRLVFLSFSQQHTQTSNKKLARITNVGSIECQLLSTENSMILGKAEDFKCILFRMNSSV